MIDDTSIESMCREKISLEFELFYIQKKEELRNEMKEWEGEGLSDAVAREKRKKVLTDALNDINKSFQDNGKISRDEITSMYLDFTKAKTHEAAEGFFKERKKCTYCRRFLYENYTKETNKYKPCKKIAAQRKLRHLKRRLSDNEKQALERGYLECNEEFMPMLDKEEIDSQLELLEREHIIIIEAWKKNLNEKILSDNL